jgi:uncharacterized repeat protein (TIGR01451 family)
MRISTKLFLLVLLALLVVPSVASAETASPKWTVSSVSAPTNFKPAGEGTAGEDSYTVTVTNTGGAAADGETSPIVISDVLPEGLALGAAGASGEDHLLSGVQHLPGGKLSCVFGSCTYRGIVVPDDALDLSFPVTVSGASPAESASCRQEIEKLEQVPVPAGESCVTNVVRVSGGGAPAAAASTPTVISAAPAGFGISPGASTSALSSPQAGAHPDLTVSTAFNTIAAGGFLSLAGDPKDTTFDLPPGFAGDLVDTPSCTAAAFNRSECAIGTQVGITTITLGNAHGPLVFTEPVYNLAPNPGEVAKLGFPVGNIFYIQGAITLRGDYGLRTTFENIDDSLDELHSDTLTLWGVPAAATHNPLRWNGLPSSGPEGHFGSTTQATPAPFFTNPTSCSGPLRAQFTVTSWQQPSESESPPPTGIALGEMAGCDRLGMEPALSAEVTSDAAYSATGFDLDTNIPQTYGNAAGLATSTLKQEVVTLPEGITVNPSSGAGLSACSEAQYAEETAPEKTAQEKEQGHGCPNSSKLATVKIKSPSIEEEVTGSAYLAEPAPRGALEPGKNPFNTLLSLYLIARAPNRGVLVKAPGKVEANPQTGRLTTTFGPTPEFGGNPASPGLPPLPASDISFQFNQGANAPLVTPPTCGDYTVTAELTPWSNSEGNPLDPSIPPFRISSGTDGGPCPTGGVPAFTPQVSAYPINNNAGSYSPFYIRIARNDGEQEITGFATQLPPGLTGNLTGIPFCTEAEIQHARAQTGAEAETSPACPAAQKSGTRSPKRASGPCSRRHPGSSISVKNSKARRSRSSRSPQRTSDRSTSAPSSCTSRWRSTPKRRRCRSPPVRPIRSRTSSKASSCTSAIFVSTSNGRAGLLSC